MAIQNYPLKIQLCWQSIKDPHEIIFIEEREIKHISNDQKYDDMETFLNDAWESVNGTALEGHRLLIVWPDDKTPHITYTVSIDP